ncbi:MAG: hypothetical protein J6I85_05635 [Clostridia bacterium]|nr:hypothetical protein [Clostridia bacterium]
MKVNGRVTVSIFLPTTCPLASTFGVYNSKVSDLSFSEIVEVVSATGLYKCSKVILGLLGFARIFTFNQLSVFQGEL